MMKEDKANRVLILTSYGCLDKQTGILYATEEEAMEAQSESEDTESDDLG